MTSNSLAAGDLICSSSNAMALLRLRLLLLVSSTLLFHPSRLLQRKLQGSSLRFQEWSYCADLTLGMDFMAV
jgi:hypothetical protein